MPKVESPFDTPDDHLLKYEPYYPDVVAAGSVLRAPATAFGAVAAASFAATAILVFSPVVTGPGSERAPRPKSPEKGSAV